jgi:hypothetical protein
MAWDDYSRSKWETIANNMPKYGCAEKWPKEMVQKKWQELHPDDDAPSVPDYETKWEQRAWSEGAESGIHSLRDGEERPHAQANSTANSVAGGSHSRAGSAAPSPMHYPQPPQHLVYENQQHEVWAQAS